MLNRKTNYLSELNLLNQAILKSVELKSEEAIIDIFIKTAIKLLKADYGFIWLRGTPNNFKKLYKSPSTPYQPALPRKNGLMEKVFKKNTAVFIKNISGFEDARLDAKKNMRSTIVLPIIYQKEKYGNLVLGYAQTQNFQNRHKVLSAFISNSIARSIKIHRLYANFKDFKNRLDRTLDSVCIFDPVSFKIEYANIGAVKFFGFSHYLEILNKSIFDLILPSKQKELRAAITSLIFKKRDSLSLETLIKSWKNKTIPVEMFLQLTGTPEGPKKFLSIIHDISSHKKLAEQSRRLLKQKDEFFSTASHELKTPVTAIKGFAQLLSEELENNNQKNSGHYLNKINFYTDKLTRLVGDLLDVSKVDSGKLKLHKKLFELSEFVKSTVEDMQLGITSHKLVLSLEGKFWVFGDPDRVAQIIYNLVDNAVKYSPDQKKVYVYLKHKNGFVTVCVEDFGIGIDKKNQRKIFERLVQIKPKGGQAFPGLGMGLYIASNIIKLHKGSVYYKNKKTKGSIFCFDLPYKKCSS